MIPAPKTYEEWLPLSAEDRKAVHFETWDVYARDGVAIAYTAATRLALTCNRKVLDIQIGTYHGGEYLLHMIVSAEDYRDCPPMLEDEFEGFRVVWMPAVDFKPLDESGATLEGSWISDDGYYEFDFTRIESGLTVSGRIGGTDSEFRIEHPTLNEQFVLFSAFDPEKQISTQHTFRLVAPNIAEDALTSPCTFTRRNQQGDAGQPATRSESE